MTVSAPARAALNRLDGVIGSAPRRRVVLALAAVLALDSADKATVGTSATQLQAGLHIHHTQIGLLLSATSLVGAVATIPFGVLADRVRRTRLLAAAIALWSVAMALSGLATGFLFLLLARMALGAVVAVATPAIASLIGDYFPQGERGRIYGFVLTGELVGAGVGFVITGQFALLSWRAPFFALIVPGVLVCWWISRLPEPARGGRSQLRAEGDHGSDDTEKTDLAHREVENHDVEPRRSAVLDRHPRDLSIVAITRYVLSVRTNVALIIASALGYFFFSGVRGFAVEFAKHQYGIGQSIATTLTLVLGIGALAGVLFGGNTGDRLLRRGRVTARIDVAGVSVLLASALFVPALLTSTLALALPMLTLAALCLGATNPPLDAARLDIIHPGAWGRAEAVRTVLRNLGDGAAPLLFGVLADSVFGGRSGLRDTFLVMLAALIAAAVLTLTVARRTYPADVAAAAESAKRLSAAG